MSRKGGTLNKGNDGIIGEFGRREQEARRNGDVKKTMLYSKAIKSIREHPDVINCGQDAIKIKGIGNFLADQIDVILLSFNNNNCVVNGRNGVGGKKKVESVGEWLSSIGLSCYSDSFCDAGYDNLLVCSSLSQEDLDQIGGISKPGHRKTLLLAASQLKKTISSTPSPKKHQSVLELKEQSQIDLPTGIPKVARTKNGGIIPKITTRFIADNCNERSFQRGEALVLSSGVLSLILDGDLIRCTVTASSRASPYSIQLHVNIDSEKITMAVCDCPYSGEGWCKHIAASLLALVKTTSSYPPMTVLKEPQRQRAKATRKRKQVDSSKGKSHSNTVPKNAKQYAPKYRSGSWALLVALYQSALSGKNASRKKDLIQVAIPLCDSPFQIESGPNSSYYTAWNSMSTLVAKSLVLKKGSPALYSLTEIGKELASQLCSIHDPVEGSHWDYTPPNVSSVGLPDGLSPLKGAPTIPPRKKRKVDHRREPVRHRATVDIRTFSSGSPFSSQSILHDSPKISFQKRVRERTREKRKMEIDSTASSWEEIVETSFHPKPGSKIEIIMLLDNREVKRRDQVNLLDRITNAGVPCETRTLGLGDVMWIARWWDAERQIHQEAVVNFIVERKTVDDLSASMDDGRYLEQKFRLKRCGVNNVAYLTQGSLSTSRKMEHFESELITTQIEDGFIITRTESDEETAEYLVALTKHFREKESQENLIIWVPFSKFNQSVAKTKNLTLQDLFAQQLLQCPGCSPQKASAIVSHFPTPFALYSAYQSLPPELDKGDMLKDFRYGEQARQTVGAALSKTIAKEYSSWSPQRT